MTYRDDPEIAKKYRSKRWKKTRQIKLFMQPFCERCLEKGIYKEAYIIHHKDYITDMNYMDDNVFYNLDNLESICLECHNQVHFGKKKEYKFDNEGNLIKNEVFNNNTKLQ